MINHGQSVGVPKWHHWQAQVAGMKDLEDREVRRIRETLPWRLPRWQAGSAVRKAVDRAIRAAGHRLLDDFYTLLRARVDLDGLMHSGPRRDLNGLVWRWLKQVTRVEQPWFDAATDDLLRRIGELCWRYQVPMDVVSIGISQFGHGIVMQLCDSTLKRRDMLAAGHYVGSLTQLVQERLATTVFRLEERGMRCQPRV